MGNSAATKRRNDDRRGGERLRLLLSRAAGNEAPAAGVLPGRAELLAGILLVALLVGLPLAILPLILLPESYNYLQDTRAMVAIIIVAVAVALLLNYRGRTRAATWVAMLGSSAGMITAAALRDPGGGRELLFFLFIPLVVCGVLLSLRDVAVLLLINALGIISFGLLPGRSFGFVILGPLVFQLFTFGLVMLLFWYQRQEERARRRRLRDEDIVYQALLERAYDGVGLLRDGRVAEAAPGFAALFGHTAADLIGRQLADFLVPVVGTEIAQLSETAVGEPIEVTSRDVDGRERQLELIAQAVVRGGQPARLVAVRDVTERVEALRVAKQLQQFAAGLRQAPDRAAMPAVITRLLLDVEDVVAAALLTPRQDDGLLTVEALSGSELCVDGCDHAALRRQLSAVDAVWQPRPYLPGQEGLIPLRVDGIAVGVLVIVASCPPPPVVKRTLAEIAVMVSRALWRATAHQATRSYASELEQRVADRTREITAANQRLQELDRLKSKFVSDVSHELRTPVTSFMLYLDLLEQGNESRRPGYIQVLRQQAQRLQDLLNDILNLSRLDLRRDDIALATLDLSQLVATVVGNYADRAAAGGLTLQYRPEPDLPFVLGQEQLLAQMVGNLLANAISYTPQGSIDVRLAPDRDALLLQVADTGPGIIPEDVPHIFDRFYRGALAAQSTIPGSGLGLALVQEIVTIHGGSVAVDTTPGCGTTLTVRLPATEREALPDG